MLLVRINNVTKTYRLGSVDIPGLQDVSLEIRSNCFTVISGPSGSGKTTLLNLIGCVDTPCKGEIVIDDQDVKKLSDNALADFRARNLGYIFQTFNLFPVLTVFENIEYPLHIVKTPSVARRRRVAELIDAVGLTGKERHRPGQLSGGQRQRVAIARALAASPKLILADEPTANLDSKTGNSIICLMRELQIEQKTSFVFSSHDPHVLAAADDVVHISDGCITSIERGKENVEEVLQC